MNSTEILKEDNPNESGLRHLVGKMFGIRNGEDTSGARPEPKRVPSIHVPSEYINKGFVPDTKNPLRFENGFDDISSVRDIDVEAVDHMTSKMNVETNVDITQCLLHDIKVKYQDSPQKRKKTWFYKFVSGGDVETVAEVIRELQSPEYCKEYQWLLNKQPSSEATVTEDPTRARMKARSCISKFLITVFQFIIAVVVTPIFYPVHSTVVHILTRMRKPVTEENCELPLAMAAISESEDMVELFKEHGTSVSEEDSRGNNVFHYLSDLSASDPEKSIRVLHMVIRLYEEQFDYVRHLLMDKTNNAGMTAFDTIVKYGSPQLLDAVVNLEGIIRKTVMSVRQGVSWLSLEDTNIINPKESNKTMPSTFVKYTGNDQNGDDDEASIRSVDSAPSYDLRRYDITQQESADVIGNQGSMLNLVASRRIEAMSSEDVCSLMNCKFLAVWSAKKIQSMLGLIVLRHLLQTAFTATFVVFLSYGDGDLNFRPLHRLYAHHIKTAVQRAEARQSSTVEFLPTENTSSACTSNFTSLEGVSLTSCEYEAFVDTSVGCPSYLSNRTLLIACGFLYPEVNDSVMTVVLYVLLIPAFVFLVTDIISRTIFFSNNITNSKECTVSSSLRRIFSIRLPGSYLAKTVTCITSVSFVIYWIGLRKLTEFVYGTGLGENKVDPLFLILEEMLTYLVIFVLVNRFIAMIWLMRLLPHIGHFVLSVYSMAKDLIDFGIIYGFVLIAFAKLFTFVMRDPSCPSVRLEEYQGVISAAYKSYTLMLGQGDFPAENNTAGAITFVMYSLFTVLLLLNLIIAVMGKTADTVMSQPWKQALYDMELLKEALEVENFFLLVTYPFRKIIHRTHLSKNGFLIEKDRHKHYRVYIEIEEYRQGLGASPDKRQSYHHTSVRF